MYDQVGFYSDNYQARLPQDRNRVASPNVNFDFGGFDFGQGSGSGSPGSVGGGTGGGASFRDLFSQFFRGGGRGGEMEVEQEPGGDLEYQIEIDFWDAVRGAVKKLQITRMETCETCHGTGAIGSPQTCPICGGTGTIQQAAGKMRFNVPCTRCGGTGKLRTVCKTCGGEGRSVATRRSTCAFQRALRAVPGPRSRQRQRRTMGAPVGDLYLRVVREAACVFRTQRQRSLRKIPVTVAEATLGSKVEVPTIDGRSLVRIPPGTNSGSTLRLSEKGVPGRNGTRGDEYVEIQVIVPKPTDERVRNLMKELEQIEPDDPRKDLFAKAGG